VGSLGGGAAAARLSGSVFRALATPAVRPHLVIAGCVTLGSMMLPPALLPLSYQLSRDGVMVYAWLQVMLIAGLTAGSLIAYRTGAGLGVLAVSLWIFGAGALAAGVAHAFWITGLALAVSAVGNALYFIANQSALLRAAPEGQRGSVMSSRYTVVQSMRVLGLLAGAGMTAVASGGATLAVIGTLLLIVAVAVSRWRLTVAEGGPPGAPARAADLAGRADR
jgi:hypothetical protein